MKHVTFGKDHVGSWVRIADDKGRRRIFIRDNTSLVKVLDAARLKAQEWLYVLNMSETNTDWVLNALDELHELLRNEERK